MNRVDRGRHYTPPALAAELVRRTLGPSPGPGLTICDPACGGGALLVEACRLLAGAGAPPRRVCGVDVDSAALERTASALAAFPGVERDLRRADALRHDWRGETFDVVLANPPWVSWSGRHAGPPLPGTRPRRGGWPSLHGLFVELAVRLCRGRAGLILPAQVCDLEGYGPVRAFVRAHGRVEPPLDFGEEAFPGVTQPCCGILVDRAAGPTGGGPSPFGGVARSGLDALPRPPPDAFADIGVHTGNCAERLLRPGGAPIREGRDVHPFALSPPRRTIRPGLSPAAGEYFRVAPLERYREIPILLRQTARRPVAALHREPTYFRNSVLACRGIPGVEDELVVAWLNSRVVGDDHRARVRESNQRAFPQLKVRHLRDLPCPPWEEAAPELRRLARAVAREGRLDLREHLDELVAAWFPPYRHTVSGQ